MGVGRRDASLMFIQPRLVRGFLFVATSLWVVACCLGRHPGAGRCARGSAPGALGARQALLRVEWVRGRWVACLCAGGVWWRLVASVGGMPCPWRMLGVRVWGRVCSRQAVGGGLGAVCAAPRCLSGIGARWRACFFGLACRCAASVGGASGCCWWCGRAGVAGFWQKKTPRAAGWWMV